MGIRHKTNFDPKWEDVEDLWYHLGKHTYKNVIDLHDTAQTQPNVLAPKHGMAIVCWNVRTRSRIVNVGCTIYKRNYGYLMYWDVFSQEETHEASN